MSVLVTGAAGFIGSELVRQLVLDDGIRTVSVDNLSFAGRKATLGAVDGNDRHLFREVDICDEHGLWEVFTEDRPSAVIHLAAETHVDRSIGDPDSFVKSNVWGTYRLLECVRQYISSDRAPDGFKLVHVSTDEVYGSLGNEGQFSERSCYDPSSPYSATKAASDHLVRAWHRTYDVPAIVTNCTNNYGPYQYPEKLIPVVIRAALEGSEIPLYGAGQNVRDWLHVGDHARALRGVMRQGRVGESYAIGGGEERTNVQVVTSICGILDQMIPRANGASYEELVRQVPDRPGHDFRYAMDSSKIRREIGWMPDETFDSGLRKVIEWYLRHQDWLVGSGGAKGEFV